MIGVALIIIGTSILIYAFLEEQKRKKFIEIVNEFSLEFICRHLFVLYNDEKPASTPHAIVGVCSTLDIRVYDRQGEHIPEEELREKVIQRLSIQELKIIIDNS